MEPEGSYPKGTNDAICYPSDDDHSITFYLRNPQKFQLEPRYSFNNPDISVTSSDLEFVQDSGDRSIARLTFKQQFLHAREMLVNLDQKDISGVVSFYEPLSGRIFDSYSVNVHANSAPPIILNPCFQLTSSGTDGTYIVCFYMPKLEQGTIHKDTYDFFVNSEHLYINGASSSDRNIYQTRDVSGATPVYTDQDTRFTTTAPTMTSLEEGGFAFSTTAPAPEGYIPMYFMTGVAPTTETTTYTFTIRDDDGLSNSIAISNKAKQLDPPSYSVVNNQTCLADEETGLYTIYITHDGLCTDGTSCGGGVSFNYTITETGGQTVFLGGTSAVKTGTATGSAVIKLPRGNYSISSTAFKNYYITSESSAVTGVGVRQSAIFYVREDGNDSDNGSRATPFRTINQAISDFKLGQSTNMYDLDSACEIRILSDLTPPADYTFASHNNAFVDISGPSFTSPVIIKGYGGQYAINANRSESSIGRVMYIATGCNVTLNNLIIKGGYTCGDYSSSDYDGAGIKNSGNLIATDCIIEHNTALNTYEGGGGIWNNAISGKLNLTRCILRYNTNDRFEDSIDDSSGYCGSAIYSDGTANDSCILTNCTITHNTGGPAICVSRIFMTGGSVTYNISKNNTECGGIKFRSGTLDGVNISYNDFDESIPVASLSTSGGGIWVAGYGDDGTESIIKNCIIKNNKAAYGAGILIFEACDSDVIIDNSTITGNTSYRPANAIDSGAGIYSECNFTLKGKNIIYNNYLSDGTTQNNVYLLGNAKINIANNISGSTIGISKIYGPTVTYKPVAGTPNDFTTNYDYPTKNNKKPQEIFISENGYGITDNEGEGAFAVSSATNINPLNYTFAPGMVTGQTMCVYPGASKTFTLAARIGRRLEADGTTYTDLYYNPADKKLYTQYSGGYSHPDASDSQLTLTAALYSGNYKIKEWNIEELDFTVATTIPGTSTALPPGNHILKIYTEFLGIKQEKTIPLAIDYSTDTVVDYINSLNTAGTYDVIVKGTVNGAMSGDNSTAVTASDKELARVAKALYSRPANVLINLDARETSCVYSSDPDNPLSEYNYAYFKNCASLQSFKMPAWMGGILPELFMNCTNLTSVEIPSSVTEIYDKAFFDCTSLATIRFGGTKEQWKQIKFHLNWRYHVTAASQVICSDGNVPFGFFEIEDMLGGALPDTENGACNTAVAGSGTSTDPFVVDGETNKLRFKIKTDATVPTPTVQEGLSYSYDNSNDHDLHIITIDRSTLTIPDNGLTRTINFVNKVFYFKLMPEPVDTVGYSIPLTFEARVADVKVTFSNKSSGKVYYKVNGGNEAEISSLTSAKITLSNAGDKVEFFGNNNTYYSGNISSSIACDKQCYVYGNVMSLVNKNGFKNARILQNERAFQSLFSNNINIDISPEHNLLLPATTLTEYCYYSMFYGCTGLTRTPELPATSLANCCYDSMFIGCTGLSEAPELPATSLASSCYSNMFSGCTELAAAPVLPATTLAYKCYFSMFRNCTKLTAMPSLPATTLEEECYEWMFEGCTELTQVTLLPATTLKKLCYNAMFYNCSKLVDASSIFDNNVSYTLAESCCQNMFYGCTSLTEAPPLPARALASKCYQSMFKGCSSLTTSPILPAATLISQCYEEMFRNCSSLTTITCLSTTSITSGNSQNYTKNWVDGVPAGGSNVGVFRTSQGMTLYSWGNYNSQNGIPQGWTVTPYTP